MGLLELLLVVLVGAGGAVALVVGWLLARGQGVVEVWPRAPLPWLPLIVALTSILVAPVPSFLLADRALRWLIGPALGVAVVTSPEDPFRAKVIVAGLLSAWLVLPGALGAFVLLLSRGRSWRRTVVLALAAWAGFGLGLVVWERGLLPPTMWGLSVPDWDLRPSMAGLTGTLVRTLAVSGLAGACAPVVALLAGGSRAALRRALLATTLMPAGALLIAALGTPPDVLTQLMSAALIGLSWLLGLGVGAVVAVLRSPGHR